MAPRLRLVVLESPYAGDVERHTRYAQACMRDSLQRGESPFVSHLLYTQVLNDGDPLERRAGIEAGLAWGVWAEATVVYTDLGVSDGMREGIRRAETEGRAVEYRRLGGAWALEDARAQRVAAELARREQDAAQAVAERALRERGM